MTIQQREQRGSGRKRLKKLLAEEDRETLLHIDHSVFEAYIDHNLYNKIPKSWFIHSRAVVLVDPQKVQQ